MSMWWERQSLLVRFTLLSSAVLVSGVIAIGLWVSNRITDGVVHNSAVSAALYADSIVEPLAKDLAAGGTIADDRLGALRSLMAIGSDGNRIVGIRIWVGDKVVYSDRREVIGRIFPMTSQRALAWSGKLAFAYRQADASEHGTDFVLDQPLLEIYAPIRRAGSHEIIALAETYHLMPSLTEDVWNARLGSWLMIGLIAIAIGAMQTSIVRAGSTTIDRQRAALGLRIDELGRMVAENQHLKERAERAAVRVGEMNEHYLRQIAADLHDGPIQLIGMCVLRLDTFEEAIESAEISLPSDARHDVQLTREAMRDCLAELRQLSFGLAAPEIETLPAAAVLELAADLHERRTGTAVARAIDPLPDDLSFGVKLCLFRAAQEGLTNSFRHAGGKGQTIAAHAARGHLVVSICDTGPGLAGAAIVRPDSGLGLVGLRDRIEALGGSLSVANRPGGGLCLTVDLAVEIKN